eukprot:scaffold8585_cov258-Pinguiococcus_pyrenoidosus.AAC.3
MTKVVLSPMLSSSPMWPSLSGCHCASTSFAFGAASESSRTRRRPKSRRPRCGSDTTNAARAPKTRSCLPLKWNDSLVSARSAGMSSSSSNCASLGSGSGSLAFT